MPAPTASAALNREGATQLAALGVLPRHLLEGALVQGRVPAAWGPHVWAAALAVLVLCALVGLVPAGHVTP